MFIQRLSRPERWIALLLLLIFFSFLYVAWIRSRYGLFHTFDTGLYLQLLDNIWKNGSWASSVTGEPNFLGHHFQPILWFLSPITAFGARAMTLQVIAGLAVLVSIYILATGKTEEGESPDWLRFAIAGTLLLHPSVAARIYFSFVPETLALPFLSWQAVLLSKRSPLTRKDLLTLVVCQIFTLLCKETFFVQNATIAFVLCLKWRKEGNAKYFAGLGLVMLAAFGFVFLRWMPAHSVMKGYYGLNYFSNPAVASDAGIFGKAYGAILNVFSENSLATAFTLLALPLGLPLLSSGWTLLGAAWPVALMLGSSSLQIQHLMNQYALPAVPFLVMSSWEGFRRLKPHLNLSSKARIYVMIVALGVPLSYTAMERIGFFYQALFAKNHIHEDLPNAVQKLSVLLPADAPILIDGSLQPLFPELQNVHVILGFKGNPYRLTDADLAAARYIITTNDLSELKNCEEIRANTNDALSYYYDDFYRYCHWTKDHPMKKEVFLDERLILLTPG